jgi:hypothetical protein
MNLDLIKFTGPKPHSQSALNSWNDAQMSRRMNISLSWLSPRAQWSHILCGGCNLKMTHKPKIVHSQNYPCKSLKSSIKYTIFYLPCNMYVYTVLYIIKSTYTSKLYSNFIFNYIKSTESDKNKGIENKIVNKVYTL